MPRSGGLVGGAVPPRDSRENGFGVALHTLRYTAFYGLAESPVLARQREHGPRTRFLSAKEKWRPDTTHSFLSMYISTLGNRGPFRHCWASQRWQPGGNFLPPLHTMHCVMVMATTWTDASTGNRKGAEIPSARACGQTAHEKSDAALHPMHCVTVMAATWTDAPEDHREGRRSPARGPVTRRRTRKVMRHCIPCIALTARRSRSGSLCSGHAAGSASRWCRLSLRERTKLSRSERRHLSAARYPPLGKALMKAPVFLELI